MFFHLPKFLLLSLVFAYIYISQGSLETHLLCGGIYNNHIIANCLQSAPVKEFWKSVNNRQRYWQSRSATLFMAHGVDTETITVLMACTSPLVIWSVLMWAWTSNAVANFFPRWESIMYFSCSHHQLFIKLLLYCTSLAFVSIIIHLIGVTINSTIL